MTPLLLILATQSSTPAPTILTPALLGSWVGTLEYRDYSDNSRVKLATLLRIYRSKEDNRLVFRYVYDDGPTKLVQDEDHIEIDDAKASYVLFSKEGKETDRYTITGLSTVSKAGLGTLTLQGKGTENDVPVEIRETLKLAPDTLDILRESKLPNKPWLFRHEFTFHRISKPSQK